MKLGRLNRRWGILASVATIVVRVGVVFTTGFAFDVGTAILARLPLTGTGYGVAEEYFGPWTMEERIVLADVIARVKLRSVAQVVERDDSYDPYGNREGTYCVGALEFTFDVLEYLKGSGGSKLKAVVPDLAAFYETELGASTFWRGYPLTPGHALGRPGGDRLSEKDRLLPEHQAGRPVLVG